MPYEPPHVKTNKMTFAPSEDSDQLGHPSSLISLCCPHEETLDPQLPIERTAKTDQTGGMPRLIGVLAGHTCHFVGFVVLWLNYHNFESLVAVCNLIYDVRPLD